MQEQKWVKNILVLRQSFEQWFTSLEKALESSLLMEQLKTKVSTLQLKHKKISLASDETQELVSILKSKALCFDLIHTVELIPWRFTAEQLQAKAASVSSAEQANTKHLEINQEENALMNQLHDELLSSIADDSTNKASTASMVLDTPELVQSLAVPAAKRQRGEVQHSGSAKKAKQTASVPMLQ